MKNYCDIFNFLLNKNVNLGLTIILVLLISGLLSHVGDKIANILNHIIIKLVLLLIIVCTVNKSPHIAILLSIFLVLGIQKSNRLFLCNFIKENYKEEQPLEPQESKQVTNNDCIDTNLDNNDSHESEPCHGQGEWNYGHNTQGLSSEIMGNPGNTTGAQL
jgi:hypothetical protein